MLLFGKKRHNKKLKSSIKEKNNEQAKNMLYSNNINILDGRMLSRYLLYNVIQKVYE